MTNQQVTTTQQPGLPADAAQFLCDTSQVGLISGSENNIIPTLKLAQSASEEVKKNKPTYIDGLQEGDFFMPSTKEIFNESNPLDIVPIFGKIQWAMWAPREESNGAPVVVLEDTDPMIQEMKVLHKRSSNLELRSFTIAEYLSAGGTLSSESEFKKDYIVTKTYVYFVLTINKNRIVSEAVLRFGSTALAAGKLLNGFMSKTIYDGKRTELHGRIMKWYARAYRLSSIGQENKKGSWVIPHFTKSFWIIDEMPAVWNQCEAFFKDIKAGVAVAEEEMVVDADSTVSTEEI